MKGKWLVCLTLLLLSFLSACDGGKKETVLRHSGPGKPAYGDAIVIGSIGEPSTLIPILASDSASSDIAGLDLQWSGRYDKYLKLEGELAEKLGRLTGRPHHHLPPAPRGEMA